MDSIRVLLVEDDPVYAKLISKTLEKYPKMHLEVTHVTRLSEAIELLPTLKPDAVLLDLNLPDSSSDMTLERFRPFRSEVAVVALTGHDDEFIATEALRLGFQDYLLKGSSSVSEIARSLRYAIERHRADKALRASDERYRLIFETAGNLIAVVSREGRLLACNSRVMQVLACAPDEVVGRHFHEFVHKEDRDRMRVVLSEIFEAGHARDVECKMLRCDGKLVEVRINLAAQMTDGRDCDRIICIIEDVSEAKSLRAQLIQAQKMESLGNLAGGIAHDFNNLLTIVLGFSELLLMGKGEQDPEREDLEKIAQAARNGADLVQRILTFSRRIETAPQPLDLNHEIRRARKLLLRTLPKNITVDLLLDEPLHGISADPGQFEQVLLNLAVNAHHAMPHGGRLTIQARNTVVSDEQASCHVHLTAGKHVHLTVSDTGLGMEEHVRERIFEPFFTTKESGEGTGLGLAMVYGIVTGHGGHIACESEPGVGTLFEIYWPVLDSDFIALQAEPKRAIEGGSETLLIVDDEGYVRDLARRILVSAGYRVLTASNGEEALDVYARHGPEISLVILDLIMPVMDGKRCLEVLLTMDPAAKVLIASGYSPQDHRDQLTRTRAKGMIKKPFDREMLLEAVRDILDAPPEPTITSRFHARDS